MPIVDMLYLRCGHHRDVHEKDSDKLIKCPDDRYRGGILKKCDDCAGNTEESR
jgi:hypothetical protein